MTERSVGSCFSSARARMRAQSMPVSGSAGKAGPRTSSRSASSLAHARAAAPAAAPTPGKFVLTEQLVHLRWERTDFLPRLFPSLRLTRSASGANLQFAFIYQKGSFCQENQNRSLNQPCSSGFSIVHKSADRPVAANFQFLKISCLDSFPSGVPASSPVGTGTATEVVDLKNGFQVIYPVG